MTLRHLSPEIVSLIHHVELNESGWWKKAVGQVVRGVMWKSNTSSTLNDLNTALKAELGNPFTDEVLQRQLDTLVAQGHVTRIPGPSYKLTEKCREELTAAHRKAMDEQEQCHKGFLESCTIYCPELEREKVWDEYAKALLGAVQVAGANLFHLLSDGNLKRDSDWQKKFCSKFSHQSYEGLQNVIGAFFAPDNQACRRQVLRLLSAHFFAESSQFSPETLSAIESGRKKKSIKVVLDTNFLFSVLQLHSNPGDDAALTLLDVAQKAGRHLDIKFYVLPLTLDETVRVLVNQVHSLERIRTTSAMANAALSQPLSSIAKKFFDAASKTPGLTASTFFRPYIEDLRTILQSRGISVLEAHPSVYSQRQDVIDDILDEQKFEEKEFEPVRRKNYDALLHDVVLWHAVRDRRPEGADSPFEAEYWAVSMDWRLIGFDRHKRSALTEKLPVVLHPSNLVQLVQFWVPRSDKLEGSLVDSLQLPLFFHSFDLEDERATVKVLEAISRFENIDDIPEHSLKIVLANQVLRGRLRTGDASNDEVFALVREEFLTQHKGTAKALEVTQGNLSNTAAALEAERAIREQTNQQLADATARADAAENAAAKAIEEKLTHQQMTDAQLTLKDVATKASEVQLHRLTYALGAVLAPILLGLVLSVLFYWGPLSSLFQNFSSTVKLWTTVAFGITPLAIVCVISPLVSGKVYGLSDWWLPRLLHWVGAKAFIAPFLFTVGAVYGGGVWDWVKATSGWTP